MKLTIDSPSESGLIIAPGRHFKVSGTLEGAVPDDAVMKVALLDADGREVRFASTDAKGVDRVTPSCYAGEITALKQGTDLAEVAYTAPELVVADVDAPEASAHDATIKCIYTDETYYALITTATDPAHGLVGEDGYKLVDHDGNPYTFIPDGGRKAFSIERTVGLSRVDDLTNELKPAVYEFYSVFPAGTLLAGENCDVTVQAFDRKGDLIEGMAASFRIAG